MKFFFYFGMNAVIKAFVVKFHRNQCHAVKNIVDINVTFNFL